MKTRKHVQIMKTGEYELSTGMVNFTKADLASAVNALESDTGVKPFRLAVGHNKKFLAGEPAFGVGSNYTLEDDGHTLYADINGIPDWLDEIMPTCFPNRSVEGRFDFQSKVGSQKHPFVLTRLSLLGIELPGISTLEDLQVATTGTPEYTLLDDPALMVSAAAVAAFENGEPMKKRKKTVAATANVEDVRRAFYDQVAVGDQFDWWIREIQIDPMQVIVFDEDDGTTYRIPYTTTGPDGVDFADPVKVEIMYNDLAASAHAMKIPYGKGKIYTKAESRPERQNMKRAARKSLCASLGLAEDASDKALKAKILEVNAAAEELESSDDADDDDDEAVDDDDESDEEDDDADDEDEDEDPPAAKKTKKTTVRVPVAAARKAKAKPVRNSDGTVRVDAEAFAQMQEDLGRLNKRAAKSEKDRQGEVIEAAVKAGKIPAKRRKYWTEAMALDPEGIEEQLEELEEIIPVTLRGTSENDATDDTQVAASAYDESMLLPAERKRLAASRTAEYTPHLEPGTIARER